MTPGARARRALVVDVIVAALLAVLALSLTAGLGVVAFFALPLLLLGLLWIAAERLVLGLRSQRAGPDLSASGDQRLD